VLDTSGVTVTEGDTTPWPPVELAEAEEPEIVSPALPPVADGDITPSPPAELPADTALETVTAALPDSWTGAAAEETGALDEGETTPTPPVEEAPADSPLRVKPADPASEVALTIGAEGVGEALGGMTPLAAIDPSVAEEKNVVNSPLPPVVDAETKVGVATPLPPVMVLVSFPEMMVVSPPPMIVVTPTTVMVLPSMVVGACSIVRV
jgi:hypothetical protein